MADLEKLKEYGPIDKDLQAINDEPVPAGASQIRPGLASIVTATLMHDNVNQENNGRDSGKPEKTAIGRFIQGIQIYENMSVFGIRGYLDMADTDNLITGSFQDGKKFIPMVGEKLLFLKFRNSLSKYWIDFEKHPLVVHKITKVEAKPVTTSGDTAGSQFALIYRLHFMSPELFWNERVSISQVMEGTYSEIVNNILRQHLGTKKEIWLEETSGVHKIIASGKPFDVIRWILSRCLRTNSAGSGPDQWAKVENGKTSWTKRWMNVADFTFYETTKGYHFKSIANTTLQTSIGLTGIPVAQDYLTLMHTALEYKFTKMTDIWDGIRDGLWASSLGKHDIYHKTLQWHHLNYIDDWLDTDKTRWAGKTKSYHPNTLVRDKILAYAGTVFETDEAEDKGKISDFPSSVGFLMGTSSRHLFDHVVGQEIKQPDQDNECERWKMQRHSEMAHTDYMNMQIVTHGMSGLQTGDMIYMKIPQWGMPGISAAQSGVVNLDPLLSDFWIIKGITHILDTTDSPDHGYKCRLDLMNARLDPLKPLPTYKDFVFNPEEGKTDDFDGPGKGSDSFIGWT